MERQLHGGKDTSPQFHPYPFLIHPNPIKTKSRFHPLKNLLHLDFTPYLKKLKRAIDKLRAENNRSFNMGDRVSEMTSKYIPKENYRNVTEHLRFRDQLRTGGPSKTSFGASDSSLITHINPYLTTTNKDHRPFTS